MTLQVSTSEIRTKVSMSEAIDWLERCLKFDSQKTVCPLRTVVKLAGEGSFGLVSSATDVDFFGVKVGTIIPENKQAGRSLVNAVYLLLNSRNGEMLATIDGVELTALRTGALSGVATKLLSNPDSRVLGVLGAGVQARYQISAVCAVREIKEIRVFSRTRRSSNRLTNELIDMGFAGSVISTQSASAAVAGADIICTATSLPTATPLFDQSDLSPGAHINAIGGSTPSATEVPTDAIRQSFIAVDNLKAVIAEDLQIKAATEDGVIAIECIQELAALISGNRFQKPIHQNSYFRAVGSAFPDLALARLIYLRMSRLKPNMESEIPAMSNNSHS